MSKKLQKIMYRFMRIFSDLFFGLLICLCLCKVVIGSSRVNESTITSDIRSSESDVTSKLSSQLNLLSVTDGVKFHDMRVLDAPLQILSQSNAAAAVNDNYLNATIASTDVTSDLIISVQLPAGFGLAVQNAMMSASSVLFYISKENGDEVVLSWTIGTTIGGCISAKVWGGDGFFSCDSVAALSVPSMNSLLVNLTSPAGIMAPGSYYFNFNATDLSSFSMNPVFFTISNFSASFIGEIRLVNSMSTLLPLELIPTPFGSTVSWNLPNSNQILSILQPNSSALLSGGNTPSNSNLSIFISMAWSSKNSIPFVFITETLFDEISASVQPDYTCPLFASKISVAFEDRIVAFPTAVESFNSSIPCSVNAYDSDVGIICTPNWILVNGSALSLRVVFVVSPSAFYFSQGIFSGASALNSFIRFSSILVYNSSTLIAGFAPSFIPYTLRRFVSHTSLPFSFSLNSPVDLDSDSAVASSDHVDVYGSQYASEPLYVQGNFPLSAFSIFFINASANIFEPCSASNYSDSNALVCYTAGIATSAPALTYLSVAALWSNTLVLGLDTYSYPLSPSLFSINGCQQLSNYAVVDCSTNQSSLLTLYGANLQNSISVLIGDQVCASVVWYSFSQITCLLLGARNGGIELAVTLDNGGLPIVTSATVSFSKPAISSVSGCETYSASTTAVFGCVRAGGSQLSIYGSSFGSSVNIYIGGSTCSVLFLSSDLIICSLPQGRLLYQSISAFFSNGFLIVSTATVSYASCPYGSIDTLDGTLTNPFCLPCPQGTYSNDGTACYTCKSGYYSSGGSSSCSACPAGSYSTSTGSCIPCASGFYSQISASVSCLPCSVNTFSNVTGSASCFSCQQNAIAGKGSSFCVCSIGYYLDLNGNCVSCPYGADCTQTGTGFQNLSSLPGFWKVSALRADFYSCPFGSASCPASTNGTCALGYTGDFCSICDTNYYLSFGQCYSCAKTSSDYFLLLGFIAFSLVCVFTLYLVWNQLKTSTNILKIVTSFCQILATTYLLYNIKWPVAIQSVLNTFQFALADVFHLPQILCLDSASSYYEGLKFCIYGTWSLMFGSFMLNWLLYYLMKGKLKILRKSYQLYLIRFTTLVLSLIYPALCLKSLSLWNCVKLGSNYYLVADYSIRCELKGDYLFFTIINICFVVIFIIGWPSFLAYYTFKLRNRLSEASVVARIGHLYTHYKSQYFYWDAIEALRQLYLTALVNFYNHGSVAQLAVSLLVSASFLLLHLFISPYRFYHLNVFNTMSLIVIFLTFHFATLFSANETVSDNTGNALAGLLAFIQVLFVITPFVLVFLFTTPVAPPWLNAILRIFFLSTNESLPKIELASNPTDMNQSQEKKMNLDFIDSFKFPEKANQ